MSDPSAEAKIRDDSAAEARLRGQLAADPAHHGSAVGLAVLLLGDGRVDEAVALLWQHIADRYCADLLREYLVGERMNEEVLRLFEQRGSEASASGLVDRAIASHLRGNLPDAAKCCELALKTDGRYAPAYNHLGRAMFNARRREPARAAFLQAVRFAPDYAEAWHNLAHVLRDERELEQAEHAYGHALRIRPAYRSALMNLGILRTALGKYQEALGNFRSVLSIDPTHAEACLNIALCQQLLRRPDAARTAYEQSITLDPRNPRAHLLYGRMCGEMLETETALKHLRDALDLNPRDPEVWGEIAIVHERTNCLEEAERAVAAGLAVAPDDPGLHLEQANLSRHRGDFAAALTGLRAIDLRSLQPHLRARHQQVMELTLGRVESQGNA